MIHSFTRLREPKSRNLEKKMKCSVCMKKKEATATKTNLTNKTRRWILKRELWWQSSLRVIRISFSGEYLQRFLIAVFFAIFASCTKGKVHRKKVKKLTSVNFAFTYTYTLKKLTLLLFPQAYMENFEKCAKHKRKKHFISY